MKIAAHQPNYLPNLAFFSKMSSVDLFVVITNLQFERHEGWQRRHKIKGPNGDIWLTVPVMGSQNQLIKDVKINNMDKWQKRQSGTFQLTYSKSVGKDYLPQFLCVLNDKWENLAELNFGLIILIKEILGIKTRVVLDNDVNGVKHNLIANICKKYKADTFVSGQGGKEYLTKERLEELRENGVEHEFVTDNLTSEYPYSTLHYLLKNGKEWVNKKIK